MIEAKILRTQAGVITGFRVSGHALAARRGEDLVCAAVSAVVQTALLGLTNTAGIPDGAVCRPGDITWIMPNGILDAKRDRVQTILETMVIGLKSIEDGHSRHLSVRDAQMPQ